MSTATLTLHNVHDISETELAKLPPEQLVEFLEECFNDIARSICTAARIVGVLGAMGISISRIKCRPILRRTLPLVSEGKVLPEAAARFLEHPALMDAVSDIPLSEQKKLADGATVKLLTASGPIEVDPTTLNGPAIRQVFRDGAIRTIDEHRASLLPKLTPPPAKQPAGKVVYDPDRGVAVVKRGGEIHIGELAKSAVREDETLREERTRPVTVSLTDDELQKAAGEAKRADLSLPDYFRHLLKGLGAI